VNKAQVDIWGPGAPVGREDMVVVPFLAYVGHIDPESLSINKDEVCLHSDVGYIGE